MEEFSNLFQTASGKPIRVSEASLMKIKPLFVDPEGVSVEQLSKIGNKFSLLRKNDGREWKSPSLPLKPPPPPGYQMPENNLVGTDYKVNRSKRGKDVFEDPNDNQHIPPHKKFRLSAERIPKSNSLWKQAPFVVPWKKNPIEPVKFQCSTPSINHQQRLKVEESTCNRIESSTHDIGSSNLSHVDKICLHRESEAQTMILRVSDVKWCENSGVANILLTDGKSSIYTEPSPDITKLIYNKSIFVGMSLLIQGAALVSANHRRKDDRTGIYSGTTLKIWANSTRRALDNGAIGLCSNQPPICVTFDTLIPDGGYIGKLRANFVEINKMPASDNGGTLFEAKLTGDCERKKFAVLRVFEANYEAVKEIRKGETYYVLNISAEGTSGDSVMLKGNSSTRFESALTWPVPVQL